MLATDDGAIQERLENFLAGEAGELEQKPVREEPQAEVEAEAEPDVETDEVEAEEEVQEEVASEDAADEDGEALELSDLANYLKLEADNLDVDDEGNLYIKTKVDGEEGRATLKDLVKSYQLEGHLNKQNMEVQELRKQLESKQAEIQQQSEAKLQQLEDLSNIAWRELMAEANQIDWNELRATDPGEFAAKSAEIQQRQARIHQMQMALANERQQKQSQAQERTQATLQQEAVKLANAIPTWKDESVATKEKADIRNYAISSGFNESELDGIADHRMVKVLRDAMLYSQLNASKPEVTKKVRKAPKLVKPGQSQTKKDRDASSLKNLKSKVQKSGGKGVEEYLMAKGIV